MTVAEQTLRVSSLVRVPNMRLQATATKPDLVAVILAAAPAPRRRWLRNGSYRSKISSRLHLLIVGPLVPSAAVWESFGPCRVCSACVRFKAQCVRVSRLRANSMGSDDDVFVVHARVLPNDG